MIKLKKGFTLIELLVTIAIIGILATFALISLNSAQRSGRNAKRRADLENIRTALEFYYSDCGEYPAPSSNRVPSPIQGSCPSVNVYMSDPPEDPTPANWYYYNRPGSNYNFVLCAYLEDPPATLPAPPSSCSSANCGQTCNYGITGP